MGVYIIAEAGVNHNGSLDMARRLIDVAADAGADAVKFQSFKADSLASPSAPKAEYQKQATGQNESQREMLRKLELSEASHHELLAHCRARGIQFLSTPFDLESLELLARKLDLPRIKLPSGEITNAPLFLKAAQTGKPLIVSTGMTTLQEIESALGVLALGYTQPRAKAPGRADFTKAFASHEGKAALKKNVSLLHCTSDYPAAYSEMNLRAMDTMRSAFGLPVGLSDHSQGIAVSLAAVARDATVIEKHFTLDRALPGPDHQASLTPGELVEMVRGIRQIEQALGSSEKAPTPGEAKNLAIVRKSVVAARSIRAGELFSEENLALKRPGTGLSPIFFWELLGKAAKRNFGEDEPIEL